ncbi:hypothetical protein U1Q18_042461, partial [Sarracenia purpurea var. burkii]
ACSGYGWLLDARLVAWVQGLLWLCSGVGQAGMELHGCLLLHGGSRCRACLGCAEV